MTKPAVAEHVESLLLEVADVVNTTLDLDTLLRRVAELIHRVIDFEIFAILLLNEKTQELRIRFQIGHSPELAERIRVKVGQGVTGLAAQAREAILVNDVSKHPHYIAARSGVGSELAVPLIVKNKVIGVIDIEAPEPGAFSDEHRRLLTLIASRIAIGIENARLYTRISKQAKTLALLNEIARDLTAILNVDELLQRVGQAVGKLIDYQMFSVLLLDPTATKLQHRFSLRYGENIHLKHDIPLGRGLVGYAAQNRVPVLVPDVTKDARYIKLNSETRSELCVPLLYKGDVIGVMDIEHTRRGYFTDDHMRTMTTLAAQVAIALENARLYERIQRQEARLERDLSMARELQFRLLPQCCPVLGKAELSARFAPATAIGGDLYDFIEYSGNRTAIAVGDVSGKGAPAAIYAALVNGIVRSEATVEPGSARMLSAVNKALAERPIDAQFVSLIYAIWNDEGGGLQIANSGLPRPIFCRDGKAQMIECVGLPLGLFPNAEYDELTVQTRPDDVFVFFSDGLLDARNHQGEQFGRERIEQIVETNCGRSADEIVTALTGEIAAFTAGMDPFDDQTVVVLRIRADNFQPGCCPPAKGRTAKKS